MVTAKRLLLIAAMVVAVVVLVMRLLPSEEKRVVRQFDRFSSWASKDQDEKPLKMTENIQKLKSLFADQCELRTDMESLGGQYSPEQIASYAMQARAYFVEVSLSFHDISVEIQEGDRAVVRLTARLQGDSVAEEKVGEVRELECELQKIGGTWLFKKIMVVEVLER